MSEIQLYPLKFTPIFKSKIWGGNKLHEILDKEVGDLKQVGESWEISSVKGELSEVSNGLLEGTNIEDLITKYKGNLVGHHIYDKFGNQFPLLIKYIDANDYLSVQVHPDDELAKKRHNSFGKTEMWYVIDAEKDAELIAGFNKPLSSEDYLKYMEMGQLREILNFEKVQNDDVLFMPAGRIHATGPGILFAEIQQSSDITYRIYDWDRTDANGLPRQLHTELARDAINFDFVNEYKTKYIKSKNKSNQIAKSPFFTTNVLEFNQKMNCKYYHIDSFVIYMAIGGHTSIVYSENEAPILLQKGETVLIPAVIKELQLNPISKSAKVLEVYLED